MVSWVLERKKTTPHKDWSKRKATEIYFRGLVKKKKLPYN